MRDNDKSATAVAWDPLRWYPDTLVQRWRSWLGARPWRRRVLWISVLFIVFLVFPAAVGLVVATAQPGSGVVDGLNILNVSDTHGVPLNRYRLSLAAGFILTDPTQPVLVIVLQILGAGYVTIIVLGIGGQAYVLSFEWLDFFAVPLRDTAAAFADQIGTPMVLVTSATIGAFFVAWFIVRGYPKKATIQVLMMILVAYLGAFYLADPLAYVLSSDGLLVQGRDLGLSVAAGLNGTNNPNPDALVTVMQHQLADNFARKPIQVWNFGHVVDLRPACEAAWSSSIMSDSDTGIRNAMRDCGDRAAYNRAQNPNFGQLGTGLILLICSTLLMAFSAYLALKVIKVALDAIYHGFMAVFGFAAGGFIYGPTQPFWISNLVSVFMAWFKLMAITVFIGVYNNLLGVTFDQAGGQVIAVIVIACMFMIVALSQLKALIASMNRGTDWVSNRFALVSQGNTGSGGGTALGMGGAQLSGGGGGGGGGGGLMATVAALTAFDNSVMASWLAGGTERPLSPFALARRRANRAHYQTAIWRKESHRYNHLARQAGIAKAKERAEKYGGVKTARGLAHAADGLADSKVPESMHVPTLLAMGADLQMVNDMETAKTAQNAALVSNPYGFAPMQKAISSAFGVDNKRQKPHGLQAAYAAQAEVAAGNLLGNTTRFDKTGSFDKNFYNKVMKNWDSDVDLRLNISPAEWAAADRNTKSRLKHELATAHHAAAEKYLEDMSSTANFKELMTTTNRLANLQPMFFPPPGSGP